MSTLLTAVEAVLLGLVGVGVFWAVAAVTVWLTGDIDSSLDVLGTETDPLRSKPERNGHEPGTPIDWTGR